MFSYLTSLFSDPKGTLMFFLLAFPGRLLAISAHEAAHAYVADRCGDPTARLMGRLTLNPAKHLDWLGTLMMLLLGFGWAKPVPVNPNNYRSYRKDDLLVSLAGIAANFLFFLAANLLLCIMICLFVGMDAGTDNMFYLFRNAPFVSRAWLVNYAWGSSVPALGQIAGYFFTMLCYFTQTNIVLAIFNLIPVPPLDGYHVLNDTILHRKRLFVSAKFSRYAYLGLMLLMFSGILGTGLSYAVQGVQWCVGSVLGGLFHLIGII